jgi:Bacteriocin-protection, YdeI or OmpD-Associated/Domain of unknown function (DUF1905)
MNKKHTFSAVIENAGAGGAYVRIPFNVEEAFGNKRVKVKATFDGEPYRGLLVRMGEPYHLLILLKEIREKIGKDFGDQVKVTVEEDVEPRVVEVPADLQKELSKNKDAQAFFDTLSYTHRREYVRWIEEAKRSETRKERIAKTILMLKKGKKGR